VRERDKERECEIEEVSGRNRARVAEKEGDKVKRYMNKREKET
jgi:hypothetical protein